jgi:dihydrofolate synthase/folylpolyglutamate synthase
VTRGGATYAELLARLIPARRFGVVLGLDRMRAVLDRLGAPDRRLSAIVHVGGTNGTGSTVAMIGALAAAAGRRVATYTSPHLSCLRERIVIDGAMISEAAIVSAADGVRGAGGDDLTFFEQVTAIAMVAITSAQVDVTVLEVGLGGRLDATNVVDPEVAVVTGVALDHEAILGDTLAQIAVEKAGIYKPGRPAIIGASGLPEAVPVLVERARAAGADTTVIDDAAVAAVPQIGMVGQHQRRNAAAAIAAIRALRLPVVASALATVRYPGRFEVIDRASSIGEARSRGVGPPTALPAGGGPPPLGSIDPPAMPSGVPRIILDGAHNPHGAQALAEALREQGERPVLVVALSADKDAAAIAAALAPAVRAVIATRYQQDRAMDPAQLAAAFSQGSVTAAPDLRAALAAAAAYRAPILIAGSLFLVGEARTLLLGAPTDPILVTDPPVR